MLAKGKAPKVFTATGHSGSRSLTLSRRARATGEGYHPGARRHKALTGRALTGPSGWKAPFKPINREAVALYLPGLNPGFLGNYLMIGNPHELHGCKHTKMSGVQSNTVLVHSARHPLWVQDYRSFSPVSHKDAHWGVGQCGFNLSMSGKVFLSDNKRIRLSRATEGTKIDREWFYPCHRDMEDGEGEDRTCLSGIYSFSPESILWLYPLAERHMDDRIKAGLASLVGVHRITGDTEVRSNSSRRLIFRLKEVACSSPKRDPQDIAGKLVVKRT